MNEEPKTLRRGKTNGYNSTTLWARRNKRAEEAAERQAEHYELTVEEKIAKAKGRRGQSKREIARLAKLVTKASEVGAEKPKAAKKKS